MNVYIEAIETRLAGLRKGLADIQQEQARLGSDAVATQGAIQILEDLLSAVLTLTPPDAEAEKVDTDAGR
jgi:hypothetical protein